MEELKILNRSELAKLMGCCPKVASKRMREMVTVPINNKSLGVPVWSFRKWQEAHAKRA